MLREKNVLGDKQRHAPCKELLLVVSTDMLHVKNNYGWGVSKGMLRVKTFSQLSILSLVAVRFYAEYKILPKLW